VVADGEYPSEEVEQDDENSRKEKRFVERMTQGSHDAVSASQIEVHRERIV
jgi:hypothetical protein